MARQLLHRGEYVPGRDIDYTSLVLESHSPENEEMWVAINALRILDSPNGQVLPRNTADAIVIGYDICGRFGRPSIRVLGSVGRVRGVPEE